MAMGGHGFREGTACRVRDRAGVIVVGDEVGGIDKKKKGDYRSYDF